MEHPSVKSTREKAMVKLYVWVLAWNERGTHISMKNRGFYLFYSMVRQRLINEM